MGSDIAGFIRIHNFPEIVTTAIALFLILMDIYFDTRDLPGVEGDIFWVQK